MNRTKNIAKLLITSVMLIAIVTLLTGCGNKKEEPKATETYEEPIKNMTEGIQNTNIEKYMSAFPDFIDYKVTQSDLDEMMNVYIEKYGQDIKISYEITQKEEITGNKLSEIQDNIKTYYNHECSVTKGYKLNVSRTVKGIKDQQTTSSIINVYEIDGKWYSITF